MANYIWTFTPATASSTATVSNPQTQVQGSGGNNGANGNASTKPPELKPTGTGLINVVRDYYWTQSPLKDFRQEVPRIILTEKRLQTNSLIAQLKYTLGQLKTNSSQIASNFGCTGSCIAGLIQGLGGSSNASGTGSPAPNTDSYGATDNPLLAPYKDLYITKDTGWKYYLPYFDNNQSTSTNAFSDSQAGVGGFDILKTGMGFLEEAAAGAAQIGNPTQYTFIEKTKFYDYASDGGEEINVEFPLINTGSATFDDVIQNWQFLYLLVYQNRPGKTGYNTVDQPVIYEVSVPGTKFFPYMYISNLTVEFVGSRREMTLNIPSEQAGVGASGLAASTNTNSTGINAIIPDAYRVRISLKSLTANTRNFMAYMAQNNSPIQTGVE